MDLSIKDALRSLLTSILQAEVLLSTYRIGNHLGLGICLLDSAALLPLISAVLGEITHC
jgi:hypothetical protein